MPPPRLRYVVQQSGDDVRDISEHAEFADAALVLHRHKRRDPKGVFRVFDRETEQLFFDVQDVDWMLTALTELAEHMEAEGRHEAATELRRVENLILGGNGIPPDGRSGESSKD